MLKKLMNLDGVQHVGEYIEQGIYECGYSNCRDTRKYNEFVWYSTEQLDIMFINLQNKHFRVHLKPEHSILNGGDVMRATVLS